MKSFLREIKGGIISFLSLNYPIIMSTLLGILVMELTLLFSIASDILWPTEKATGISLFMSFVVASFAVFWGFKIIISIIHSEPEEEINGFR
jgi:hypothetical protein